MQLALKSDDLLAQLRKPRLWYAALVALSALYAIYMLAIFPHWVVDDAYISFRYSYNLVMHGELNWNVGYDPVEGYTGIMLPLLVAPTIALGGNPAVASQCIGVISFFACAVLLWLLAGQLELPPLVRAVVVSLFLIAPALYSHAFAGLETLAFTALILASLYALLRRTDTLLPILLLVTSLTRPEGALLAALFMGVRLLTVWRSGGNALALAAKFVLLYGLPGAGYFIWRWSYYGYLLPNTFYVKTGGTPYVLSGVMWFLAYLLFPTLATALTIPTFARIKRYRLELLALFGFVLALFALYSRTMLVMNYGHRFYMPLYPLVLLLLGAVAGFERRQLRMLVLAVVPLAAQLIWSTTILAAGEQQWIVEYRDVLTHEHIPTAAFIAQHVPADEWIILNDTGLMPYLTQRKTIDSGALNDEFLAHNHDPEAVRVYLRSFHAAAITIPWFEGSDAQKLDPYSLIPDATDYRLITSYKDPQWVAAHRGFRVYLFLRNDLAPGLLK